MSQFKPEAVLRIAFEVPSAGMQRHGGGGHARRLAKRGELPKVRRQGVGQRTREDIIVLLVVNTSSPLRSEAHHHPRPCIRHASGDTPAVAHYHTSQQLTPSVKMAARFFMMGDTCIQSLFSSICCYRSTVHSVFGSGCAWRSSLWVSSPSAQT